MALINEARIAGLKPGSAPSLILFHLDMWILGACGMELIWRASGNFLVHNAALIVGI